MTDLPPTDLPQGALAAMVTPLTAALEPNIAVLIAHGRWLLAHGCTGLVMLAGPRTGGCLEETFRCARFRTLFPLPCSA